MPSRPPNIILTIADDQRGTALGCAGREPVSTPALDRLAARGVRFAQAQHLGACHGAVCAPSRAMLMTGIPYFQLDPSLLGVTRPAPGTGPVPLPPTLGGRLRGAGYHTFATGKWHNGTASFQASFDSGANLFFGGMIDHWFTPVYDFDPTGEYPAAACRRADGFSSEIFAQSAIDFIRSRRGSDQPFFCYCALTAPHDPRTPPDAWRRRYSPMDMQLPPNFDPGPAFTADYWREKGGAAREAALVARAQQRFEIRDELLLGTPRIPDEIRRALAAYYAMISHMDDWIGRIHQAVEEAGMADNTIIVHTADHGLAVGQHGLLGKQNLHQHSLQVPLLLAGPGIPRGRVSDALCYQHDLHPTLARLGGAGAPGGVFRDLLPLLEPGTAGRPHVAAAYRDTQRSIRDSRHKLIDYTVDGETCSQLFDLEADPWETRNLAGDDRYRGTAAALRGELARWQREVGDSPERACLPLP